MMPGSSPNASTPIASGAMSVVNNGGPIASCPIAASPICGTLPGGGGGGGGGIIAKFAEWITRARRRGGR